MAASFAWLVAALALQSATPQINDKNYEAWKTRLGKVVADAPYHKISWFKTVPSAMRAGIDGKKPILFWLERGHPLALTSTHGIRMRTDVLGNAELQAKLKSYACAALSVEMLEEYSSAHALDLVKQLPTGQNATHRFEGLVLFAPTGKLLGSTASLDPAVILKDLATFEAQPAGEMPENYRDAWLEEPEDDTPKDLTLIRFLSQDLPRTPPLTGWQEKAWNFGYAALTPEAIDEVAPLDLNIGESLEVNKGLVKFFGQILLVDAVRGLPTSIFAEDVRVANLQAKLESEEKGIRLYSYQGRVTASATGEWSLDADDPKLENSDQVRGLDLTLRGRAKYDTVRKKLTQFELIGVGPRWGGSPLNGRRDDTRPSDFAVLITIADPSEARYVPTILEND